ncbi:MAG: hypothetical protein LBS31_03050 [Candidatus Adiutrix sp.]|jgi:hypothetical protein|nr:hypothetical protein [Candidatus Adiutrix sp.]
MAGRWRWLLKKTRTGGLWFFVWLSALAVPFSPPVGLVCFSALLWSSALALAPGKIYGRRLTGAAVIFILFWSLFIFLSRLLQPGSLRPVLNLIAWVGLGLHLMLIKTPLELAALLADFTTPLLGSRRADKLALSLALLARLIPRLLDSALALRATLKKRASGLPLTARLSLWGRAVMREGLRQSEDMAQALLKRWPWR